MTNGLLKVNGKESISFLTDKSNRKGNNKHPFYAVCCKEDTLYFASDGGRVWTYSLHDEILKPKELPIKDKIVSIDELGDFGLLVTTEQEGIMVYNPKNGEYRIMNSKIIPQYPDDAIHSVYIDREQIAWFEMTEWGKTFRFNPKDNSIKVFKTPVEPQGADRSYPPFHICEDTINHYLWIHPQGGDKAICYVSITIGSLNVRPGKLLFDGLQIEALENK